MKLKRRPGEWVGRKSVGREGVEHRDTGGKRQITAGAKREGEWEGRAEEEKGG